MIPGFKTPKYKALVRIRTDVWQTLKYKSIKNKKWQPLLGSILKFYKSPRYYKNYKKPEFSKRLFKKINFRKAKPLKDYRFDQRGKENHKNLEYFKVVQRHSLIDYRRGVVSRFPVYHEYLYQKLLFTRLHIRIIYGRLQDYKLKKESLNLKGKPWLNFAQRLEQKAISLLYRYKLVSTYKEGVLHHKHKRILVNGNYKEANLKKGDVLHFTPTFEKLLRRRIVIMFFKQKTYYFKVQSNINFDVDSIRFIYISNNTTINFKYHPFRLPFERVYRWYTRV